MLDRDLETVASKLRGRVLEVGGGAKRRRGRFRPPTEGVSRWVCVDRERSAGPDVQCDVTHLPFRDACFDAVVCLEVLEYVEDPMLALRQMRALLRPDGVLALSIPFLHRWDTEDDLWRPTPEGLRRLLGKTGFRVTVELAQGGALATAANILAYVVRNASSSRLASVLLALVAAPVIESLFRLDALTLRHRPLFRTFSTGYLFVAQKT